jgi:hypothetical protein
MVSHDERLFVSPTGRAGGSPNEPESAIVLVSRDPVKGRWRPASAPGFGDADNLTMLEMASFNGYLYAGTLNAASGFQLWKTQTRGRAPYDWKRVLTKGAHRGPLNEGVLSMCPFAGALYIGTCIQNGGYDRAHDIGPGAPELLRVHPDDSWDLVVGEARHTPDGVKEPISEFGSGFDSTFAGYVWRLAEHDGVLYAGTFDWSILLPYLAPFSAGDSGDRLVRWFGAENLVSFNSGFSLFRSTDGVRWSAVTTDGFGNPFNFGARTIVGTPYGLFVGTANPFGPEVAARQPIGWSYVANPDGGAEVWLGSQRFGRDGADETWTVGRGAARGVGGHATH